MKMIGNAFSLNMVKDEDLSGVKFEAVNPAEINLNDYVSVVGHADTAKVLSTELNHEVVMNRASVTLGRGDELLVCQYNGPRLEEGATSLPEGANFRYLMVTIK